MSNRRSFPPPHATDSLRQSIRVLRRTHEASIATTPDATGDELARVIAYAKRVDADRDALRDRVAYLEHWRWALVLVLLALLGVSVVDKLS